MPEQAIQQFGPYYESAIRRQLPQRQAIGQAPLSPEYLSAITEAELREKYMIDIGRSREATRATEAQQQYGMQRRAEESREKAATVSGISQIAGGTLGSLALASQIPVTAATPAIAGTIGGEGVSAATGGTSLLGAGAEAVGSAASFAWESLLGLLALCPISTAAVVHLGKTDDCVELRTLRWFRDNVLRFLPRGKEDIETYYRIAPKIVEKLNKKSDAHKTYKRLWDKYIYPSVLLIWQCKYKEAHKTYKDMMIALG